MVKYNSDNKAPIDEQKICVTCGFCCDGTLFLHAHLDTGERGGGLPVKIEESGFTEEGKDYFRLPCHYFSGKCTIYDQHKANVCSSYRCQLLKDFTEGRITIDEALETVREAVRMRAVIMEEYRSVTGKSRKVVFRKLLIALGKILKTAMEERQPGDAIEMLLARSNIFEALLIKHFRSAEVFEKMIMK
jgi:hypothetical protein